MTSVAVTRSVAFTSSGTLTSRAATLLQKAFRDGAIDGPSAARALFPVGAQKNVARRLEHAGFLIGAVRFAGEDKSLLGSYRITLEGERALVSYYNARGEACPAGLGASRVTGGEPRDTEVAKQKVEAVNHPAHYGGDTMYEVIKVLRAWSLTDSFELSSAVKYIARAGKKDPAKLIEDLEKAVWYLNSKIAELRAAKKDQG